MYVTYSVTIDYDFILIFAIFYIILSDLEVILV